MTYKGVTNAQLDHLKQMAKGKGVDRTAFQTYGLDGGIIAKAMELIVQASKPVVQAASNLLRFVTTISVPGVPKFVAKDRFVSSGTITFYLDDNFKTHFLSKVEENVPAADLAVHTLTSYSLDEPIRKELGAQREETTLAYLYELLSRQPKGESGVLLTNGYATIFYIKDANGKLWAVGVGWDSRYGEWHVRADSITYPDEWHGGYRVFSRK